MPYDPADEAEYGSAPQTFGRAANLPPPPPSGADWTQGVAGGVLGGIGAGMRNNQALGAWAGLQRQQALQLQEQVQKQHVAEQKRLQDRQDLLATLEMLKTGASIPGKFGDAVKLQALMKFLPEEEAKAIAKEDDETMTEFMAPAIARLIQENPALGLSGAKTLLQQMGREGMAKYISETRQMQDEKKLSDLEGQMGKPQQQQAPAQPAQDPMMQLRAEIQNLDAAIMAVKAAPVAPAVKKQRLLELEKARDNKSQDLRAQETLRHNRETEAAAARREDLQRENMTRLAGQFAQSFARQSDNQDRIDARQERYLKAFMERPMDATTQKDIAALESITRQVGNVEQTYKKEYLGPVRGTDVAFDARRTAGSAIGMGVGEDETIFRQSLADVSDQLLRARSGAQINETEYKRLRNMLPKATDEEPTFKAGLKRFKSELEAILQDKIRLGSTARKNVEANAPSSERVEIISPSGVPGTIPASQLQDALKKGYKRK